MNKNILNELSRQHELMSINEQFDIRDAITKGIFNSLMKDTLGMELPDTEDSEDSETLIDKSLSNVKGKIKHSYGGEQGRNVNLLIDEMVKQGITNPYAQIGILSVIAKEAGFKMFKEKGYGSTSNSRIRNIFGSRASKYSDEQLNRLKKNDAQFFDAMYGKDSGMKLGNTEPGDGWKYVGRGFNGITGRANYRKYGSMIGQNLESNPELLEDPKIAAKAAIAFLTKNRNIPNFKDKNSAIKYFSDINAGGQSSSARNLAMNASSNFDLVA
jgi:predicted chitinase